MTEQLARLTDAIGQTVKNPYDASSNLFLFYRILHFVQNDDGIYVCYHR
ncbi:MAG: hypothetical protein WCX28_11170 [Bacteriovoracaceae bacterium]|nr:hypothetical protein [Bacteroidota bacterium]